MSLEKDIQEIKKTFEALPGVETLPGIEPIAPPAEPEKKPEKPSTPIRPTPGIQPKPKAFNQDVELFLKKRNLNVGESLEEAVKVSIRKYEGDDEYSWAVFKSDQSRPVVAGLGKREAQYHKQKIEQMLKDKQNESINEKLKPCKKCGGDAEVVKIDGDWVAQCKQCNNEYHGCDVKQWTTKEWNKLNEAKPLTGVHPEKKEWIKSGDEELNKILPELSEPEQRYLETIASESYAETVKRVEEYTGITVKPSNLPSLAYLLMETLEQVTQLEKKSARRLEEMALELVFSVPEFHIVEEAYLNDELGFDIKLDNPDLKRLTSQKEDEEKELSTEEELNLGMADLLKDQTDEDLRRRFANLLISGGSIDKLYLFNMANDRLVQIDPNLPTMYGILASVAQIGYWVTPFGIEQAAAEGGVTSAGSEEVVPKGDKYILKVRGTTFPYLVHELVKSIYEYLALDPTQQVAMQKDKVEDETKDIIAGPGIYKSIVSYVPDDRQELIPIIQKKLTGLSAKEIQDVLAKNPNGQQIMNRLIGDAEKELGAYRKQKEEYVK
jgi:hypothetical protein